MKEYSIINLSATVPSYPNFKTDNRGWIKYDDDNLFPQKLVEMYNNSPTHEAIINNKITYICGAGIDDAQYKGRPNPNSDWDGLIEKLATDYVLFGGFCFEVILNEDGKSKTLFHKDFSSVRIGAVDEYGDILNYCISDDWSKTYGKYKPLVIDSYNAEKIKTGKNYLYYYRDYKPGLQYYPIPDYYAASNYIKSDGLLGSFYHNSINNGFTSSAIITMPSNPVDEDKQRFEAELKSKFGGTNGANSIAVLWGGSQEIKPIVTPFTASNNADLYNNVNDVIFQKIVSAHQLTSPTLAGLSGSGNLSGNASEIINSYVLYNQTVIRKLRRKILDTLNIFVTNNGYDKLEIIELDIVGQINENINTQTPLTNEQQ